MQPYQEASVEMKRQAEAPGKALKEVGLTAASLAGGGAILSRVLPFLHASIPADLAIKGISKVSPGLGKFIQGAVSSGYTASNAMDYLKDKLSNKDEEERVQDVNQGFNDLQSKIAQKQEMLKGLGQQQPQTPQPPEQQAAQAQGQMGPGAQKLMAILQELKNSQGS